MNTPYDVEPLDLLRLALAEFKRYDELASGGAYEMFSSARLARELVREAVEVAAGGGQ